MTGHTEHAGRGVALTAAETLGQYAHRTMSMRSLPPDVVTKTRFLLLDQLGVQIGCSRTSIGRAADNLALRTGRMSHGGSTIIGIGRGFPPEVAAFTNAAKGHAEEFDDTCLAVQTHSGAVVCPTAVAVAEDVDAPLEQMVHALALGTEVMLRVAASISPQCLLRGIHTPQVAGPFGAAVAAGLLLGASPSELTQALCVAGSSVGGLTEYSNSGGLVKRMHCAIPVTWGIRSAQLAMSGVTGPRTIFEGKKGLCQALGGGASGANRIVDELGADYWVRRVAFKAYNCCYFIHAAIEAALDLASLHDLSVDMIEKISVGTSKQGVQHVGQITEPFDAVSAQFSMAYSVARALAAGPPDLRSYGDPFVPDTDVLDLAKRVEVTEDQTCTAEYPSNWGAVVRIRTGSGNLYQTRVRHARGTPERPLTEREIVAKFSENCRGLVEDRGIRMLVSTLTAGEIGSAPGVRELLDSLDATRVEPPLEPADPAGGKPFQNTNVSYPPHREGTREKAPA